MDVEKRVWTIVAVLVSILVTVPPLLVAYDLLDRGPIPQKKLELSSYTTNPMRDFSSLGNKLVVVIESEPISNLSIAQATISNVGRAPILPSDYSEPIRVKVPDPWKILAIGEGQFVGPRDARLQWRRISDTEFEASPCLINPGDALSASIYLTNTTSTSSPQDIISRIDPVWTARIVNLREISLKAPSDLVRSRFGQGLGIIIQIQGWAVPFVIVVAALYLALFIYLASRAGFAASHTSGLAVTLLGSILSFSLAEVLSEFVFSSLLMDLSGGPINTLNIAVIALNVVALTWLYRRARPKRQS